MFVSSHGFSGRGGGAGAVANAACSESRSSRVRTTLLHLIFKETKSVFPAHSQRFNIVGDRRSVLSLRPPVFDFRGQWRAVSSHSFHHPQEVLMAQFSLYVHKSGLKPHSLHFISHGLSRVACSSGEWRLEWYS